MSPADRIARYGALAVMLPTGSILIPLTGEPAHDAKLERFAALGGHVVTRTAPGQPPPARTTDELPDEPPF